MEKYSKKSVLATHVVGKRVLGHDHETLGRIVEIVIDKESGQVSYAVLSSGGFLGMGEEYHALPWAMLQYNYDEDAFIVNIYKEHLKTVAGFDKNSWPEFADAIWVKAIKPVEKLFGSTASIVKSTAQSAAKSVRATAHDVIQKTTDMINAADVGTKGIAKKAAKTITKKTRAVEKEVKKDVKAVAKPVKKVVNKVVKEVKDPFKKPTKDTKPAKTAKSAKAANKAAMIKKVVGDTFKKPTSK